MVSFGLGQCGQIISLYKSAWGIKTIEILLRINILNIRRTCWHPKFMRNKNLLLSAGYCIAILQSIVLYIESWHKKYGWITMRVQIYKFKCTYGQFWWKRSKYFVVQVSMRYQNTVILIRINILNKRRTF